MILNEEAAVSAQKIKLIQKQQSKLNKLHNGTTIKEIDVESSHSATPKRHDSKSSQIPHLRSLYTNQIDKLDKMFLIDEELSDLSKKKNITNPEIKGMLADIKKIL